VSRWTENPKKAVRAKIRGIQKINSRWIENPKGRSRQKLGICKKEKRKKRTEASQFKWAKQKNTPFAGVQMATVACGLINSDFCQFD